MMFTKLIVIVDKDVNVHDTSEVLFRIGNNVDWKRDTMIVEGPVDALDHAAPLANLGGKMGIDATRKGPDEGTRAAVAGRHRHDARDQGARGRAVGEYGIS